EWLVHQDDARVVDQRLGQGDAFAHAPRKLVRIVALEAGQADPGDPVPGLLVRRAFVLAAEARPGGDVVQYVLPGKDGVGLEDVTDVFVDACYKLSENLDLAGAGRLQTGDQRQGCRLATTGRTDHGAELSGLDLQVQVTQGGVRLTGWGQKALVDAPQLDRRGGAGWAHGSERTVPAGVLAIVVATTRPCGHKSHSVHCVHGTATPEAAHEGLVIASGGSAMLVRGRRRREIPRRGPRSIRP